MHVESHGAQSLWFLDLGTSETDSGKHFVREDGNESVIDLRSICLSSSCSMSVRANIQANQPDCLFGVANIDLTEIVIRVARIFVKEHA